MGMERGEKGGSMCSASGIVHRDVKLAPWLQFQTLGSWHLPSNITGGSQLQEKAIPIGDHPLAGIVGVAPNSIFV